MTSVRLNLIIAVIIFLLLSLIGNSETVTFDFLWFTFQFPLFGLIIFYCGIGAFLTFLFYGHINYIKRIRDRFFSE
ncbi:MAG: LapA family protein [Leptospiraceae bacterium]|nr:LapA family protein [Leptospiraceae bacterium]NUM40076.1 LapA family protein [Leptospiraceae bacterium]